MKNLATWQKILLYIFGFLVAFWFLGIFTSFYGWIPRFYLPFWTLLLAINVLFALGVMRDAESQIAAGRKVFFVAARFGD